MYDIEELARAGMLSALVYLDSLLVHKDAGDLHEVVKRMKKTDLENWPCKMSRSEWLKIMEAVQRDRGLRNLRVINTVDEKGHRAVLFGKVNQSESKSHGYIIFRGTGSAEEWEDNALGMLEPDTERQKMAAQFVRKNYHPSRSITVAGHSKGGNKAQYAAITLPEEYIERCYSFDGQGFSVAFCEKYRQAIETRKPVINLVSERRGFVHALGLMINETGYYTGWRGSPRDGLPHGDSLSYFHCPDSIMDISGGLGVPSAHNIIPAIISQVVTHFLKNQEYIPFIESTALGLTSIISSTDKQEEKIAAAIAQLLMVFMNLVATDEAFRNKFKEMILIETDVLLATMDASRAAYSENWTGELTGLGKKSAQQLALRLAADKEARRQFIKAVRFIFSLRRKLPSGRHTKLYGYIAEMVRICHQVLRNM